MKKQGIILLIAVYCAFQALGCSSDKAQQPLMVTLLGMASVFTIGGSTIVHPPENPPEAQKIAAPSAVTATDGTYKNKVGIDWATVSDAVSYRIYRSSSISGPFTEQIASVNAADLVNANTGVITSGTNPGTVTTTATSGTCSNPVMQATYQSTRDIGDWIYLPPEAFFFGTLISEHYTINLYIGGAFKGIVTFTGKLIGKFWSQQDIVDEFNKHLGSSGTCYPVTVNGKKLIKIVSSQAIRMTNQYESTTIAWVPLDFLDFSSNIDTVIDVQPVQISCNDTTAPTVSQVSPANGATDIALNAKVSVAFSEPINTATLTASSFTLSGGGSQVAGTVDASGVLTPSAELTSNVTYTAIITTAVKDLAGNSLATNYTWTFTTCSSVAYYYVDANVTQGSHYYYVVTAVDADGNESAASKVEEGFTKANDSVPSKVATCSASKGLAGNITVTWSAATNATYYKVYRITSDGSTLVGDNIAGTSYIDASVGPGIYSYKVAPFNTYGEGGSSDPDAGYRSVNNDEFFSEVYKENVWALNHIQKLKESGTGMLGKETLYDPDGNGTLVYDASANLSQAILKLTFTNFSAYYLIQNTESNASITATLKDPMGACSGPMTGKLLISGVYNGYVRYDLQMSGGTVTGGSYWVSQNGETETEVPYDSDLVY